MQATERIRTRQCETCNAEFSYAISRGTDRKHCSPKCRRLSRIKRRESRKITGPFCTSGCGRHAERRGAGLCDTCYCRLRRTGTITERVRKYGGLSAHGYRLRFGRHPLARKNMVYEHRAVLFDAIGIGPHPCHWCRATLSWDEICVDHLNEDKLDNRILNLVVSCNNCNRARGSMIPFIARLNDEAVQKLFDAFILFRTNRKAMHHNQKTRRGE